MEIWDHINNKECPPTNTEVLCMLWHVCETFYEKHCLLTTETNLIDNKWWKFQSKISSRKFLVTKNVSQLLLSLLPSKSYINFSLCDTNMNTNQFLYQLEIVLSTYRTFTLETLWSDFMNRLCYLPYSSKAQRLPLHCSFSNCQRPNLGLF